MASPEIGKSIDVTPRLVTPEEAARLVVDDLPVEPREWAEAWHAQTAKSREVRSKGRNRITRSTTGTTLRKK